MERFHEGVPANKIEGGAKMETIGRELVFILYTLTVAFCNDCILYRKAQFLRKF